MVNIIASRAAAFRLGWIIAALMVPVVFLGYFMVTTLLNEKRETAQEKAGIELISLLIPVVMDASANENGATHNAKLLREGPALAKKVLVTSAFEKLRDLLQQNTPPLNDLMVASYDLINQLSESSGLIYDAQPESYNLAIASSSTIPKLVLSYKQLNRSAKKSAANNGSDTDSLAQLLLDTGSLGAASDQVMKSLNAAHVGSHSNPLYVPILNLAFGIKGRVASFGLDIRYSFMRPETMSTTTFFQTAQMTGPILDEYESLWNQVNNRFLTVMEMREQALFKKMQTYFLASIAAILLGLGLAFTMFKSTLKRLDDVEQARVEADTARGEAENMAERLSTINSDMARVNRDLAQNMDMLKDAQDALVKKGRMEQMGQLTATIAHELRNPLGAVRTSAFLIDRKIKDKGLGIEPQLARINNGITRCDNIITQLLDFSRSKQLAATPADLDAWLAHMIEEEAKALPAAVALEVHLGLDGLYVPFDPARLQRAMINLVSNASEAMVGNGEDASKFAVAKPCISISTTIEKDMIVITVKDNGLGIAPDILDRIREPLFTTKSFGTGLGLPAVEQIANQHGGSLDITSQVGHGASFSIRLPLIQTAQEAA